MIIDQTNYVKFFSDGQLIQYRLPNCKVTGITTGHRAIHYYGEYTVVDKINDFHFSTYIGKADGIYQGRFDAFHGDIVNFFSRKNVLGSVEGYLTSQILIDQQLYFDMETMLGLRAIPVKFALPSDGRFRADKFYYKRNKLQKASE